MDERFFYELVELYGLFAVFFLAMIEGDITLLLAGVLAHSRFFGEYSFIKVLSAGTLGGITSDAIAYALGRSFRSSVREYRFYRAARPRIERLTEKFGSLSIFFSKYIYGLRTASCIFYGVAKMPYRRFIPLTLASCFLWAFVLSGAGYFFSGTIETLIGDFHQIGIYLLVIVVVGIASFYLLERFWLAKKVEEADPERVQKLEHAAHEKLHVLSHEIKEHIHLRRRPGRRRNGSKQKRPAKNREAKATIKKG